MEENNVLQEGQVVEVDYNKDLVEEYKRNYIMEEEGIGALDEEPFDTQSTLNEVPFEDMIEDGEVIPVEVIEDDTNN